MTKEFDPNATDKYISDLNQSFPEDDVSASGGNDHIQMIKQVLKNTFPNADSAITLQDAEAAQQLSKFVSGDPNGNVTADHKGQWAFDTSHSPWVLWVAQDATDTDWTQGFTLAEFTTVRATFGFWNSIQTVDPTNNKVSATGDFRPLGSAGDSFSISGSTGNDGRYTINSMSYDSAADTTTFTTQEDISDSTADGTLRLADAVDLPPGSTIGGEDVVQTATTTGGIGYRGDSSYVTEGSGSDSFVVPDNIEYILVGLQGAGGGSGASDGSGSHTGNGGGGGGGAFHVKLINVTPGAEYFFTIGAGGDGAVYSGSSSTDGEDTIMEDEAGNEILRASGGLRGESGGGSGDSSGGDGGSVNYNEYQYWGYFDQPQEGGDGVRGHADTDTAYGGYARFVGMTPECQTGKAPGGGAGGSMWGCSHTNGDGDGNGFDGADGMIIVSY